MVIVRRFFIWLEEEKIYIKEKTVVGKVDILNEGIQNPRQYMDMSILNLIQK